MTKSPASYFEKWVLSEGEALRNVERDCSSADNSELDRLQGYFCRIACSELKDTKALKAKLLIVTREFANASDSERRNMTEHCYGPHEKICGIAGDLVHVMRRAKSAAIAFREFACRDDKAFPCMVGRVSEPYWMDSTLLQSLVYGERRARSILEQLVNEPRSSADSLIPEFEKWITKLYDVVEAYTNTSLDSLSVGEEVLT